MMELLTIVEDSAFAIWLRESTSLFAYPLVLALHTVGLAVLVGANAAFDLRILGYGRGIPLERIESFFPAMWFGFWLNLVTGIMLFATVATTKGVAPVFLLKLGLVAIGVAAVFLSRRSVYRTPAAPIITIPARAWAVVSLVVWAAAITTGRLMAYL
jgi:hypothetical protein